MTFENSSPGGPLFRGNSQDFNPTFGLFFCDKDPSSPARDKRMPVFSLVGNAFPFFSHVDIPYRQEWLPHKSFFSLLFSLCDFCLNKHCSFFVPGEKTSFSFFFLFFFLGEASYVSPPGILRVALSLLKLHPFIVTTPRHPLLHDGVIFFLSSP